MDKLSFLMERWHELFSRSGQIERDALLKLPVLCSNTSLADIIKFEKGMDSADNLWGDV